MCSVGFVNARVFRGVNDVYQTLLSTQPVGGINAQGPSSCDWYVPLVRAGGAAPACSPASDLGPRCPRPKSVRRSANGQEEWVLSVNVNGYKPATLAVQQALICKYICALHFYRPAHIARSSSYR